MKVQQQEKKCKILQYGERVWGITEGTEEQRIDETIDRTRSFFASLGLKTKLSEVGCEENMRAEIVKRFKQRDTRLGEDLSIDYKKVEAILSLCK